MTRKSDAERQEAVEQLRGMVKPGDTVYTILRKVSRSGMSRQISVVLDGMNDVTWLVARAIGWTMADSGGLKVSGCGMDMGYHVVTVLSRALFPDGYVCIGKGCPSNDHSNFDRDYAPHHHKTPDYALKHRWL